VAFDRSTFGFYRAAIALRKRSLALRRGEIEFLPADDAAKFLAFRRTEGKEELLVGFNRGQAAHAWRIPTPRGGRVNEVFTASGESGQVTIVPASDAAATAGDGETIVRLPPLEAVVLRVIRPE
jgi:hypothetical protein